MVKQGVAKKKLGTDTTGARIADGKVYYATYPEGGTHMNKTVTGTERIINCYSHRMLMTKMAILFRKNLLQRR